MDWFQTGKGVRQTCILSPSLFNFYAEYIMQNARRDESQAGIKIARRNSNNLRYADDTILMAESEEELKSLLMRVKEKRNQRASWWKWRGGWKNWFKTPFKKPRPWHPVPITSWQTDGEKMETVTDFIFLGFKNHCGQWLQPWNSKTLAPKKLWQSYEKLWQS